ncbi:hypothetical protein GUITHDRAFT_105757 [Guillardia theta CCMP2712]|uniref:Uncharacterized protein n=1 Tax=Guillardia theta (strain CCMP2712) TaxID=905079 RepID=L1JJD7_GUITC|nr:hypothetical protein GUITHDRAFT_105757 [Guillardia theta CCMP2712]EKX48611.1 hypothetical protein GUITHDRAFT_105757 [Guillardia theta CCMP2712]|eukprot:XP_005835591.1 hypothetical protein GUITHDRAFT_105757 [Guillardia theta CCMP2712]
MGGGSKFWSLVSNKEQGSKNEHSEHELDSREPTGCASIASTPGQVACFLKNKKVSVDLSFWIVRSLQALHREQHEKLFSQHQHLRAIFFLAIRLASTKHGAALPVFVADPKDPPPDLRLKNEARIQR